jgi:small subunit ribosomal protein S1
MDLTNLDTKTKTKGKEENLQELLSENPDFLKVPKIGDIVKGKVLNAARSEVRLDLDGLGTGVVRGYELYNESAESSNLKTGDEIEATVIDLENENGEIELSFRYAGQKKAWDELEKMQKEGQIIEAKVTDANKGGLIVNINHTAGFLPVSQLIPEHYPRVPGGEKNKILEKLRQFIGQSLKVKVINASPIEEKLIVSEKAAWEEEQKDVLSALKVGDIVEGKITAVADFGAFLKFNNLEGLIHISELAWQRIDHPREVVKIGQDVKAEIISIDGSKIFLSMKKLTDDPWKRINEKYKVGQIVKGKILKANPFGFFVELDPEIHGLAHISELSSKPIRDPLEVAKIGDTLDFKIVSIEPTDHRLGLSLKALKEKPKEKSTEKLAEEKPAEKPTEEAKTEVPKEEAKEETEKEEKV